ncbi:MAG: rRNA maturation RNase YbeY [Anaerovoracaceae bacterium]|jgi:probable rRNA maturation factor
MELIFSDDAAVPAELRETMRRAAGIVLRRENIAAEETEIDVSFVDAAEIRRLNAAYRQTDRVTDVLSFPQYEAAAEIPRQGPVLLGDVVLCTERACEQAAAYGHSGERELVYLFVHSLHHLLGYDHLEEAERRVMRAAEEAVMDELGLPRTAGEADSAAAAAAASEDSEGEKP